MTNFEKIQKAWRMGWAAVLKLDNTEFVVVYVEPSCVLARLASGVVNIYHNLIARDFKILGYKYAGELAGNEEPEEGQKWKIRQTGEIIEIEDQSDYPNFDLKRMIEPYFE